MDKEIKELLRFVKSVLILFVVGVVTTGLLYIALYFMMLGKIVEGATK